jgi:hypothetical protein
MAFTVEFLPNVCGICRPPVEGSNYAAMEEDEMAPSLLAQSYVYVRWLHAVLQQPMHAHRSQLYSLI